MYVCLVSHVWIFHFRLVFTDSGKLVHINLEQTCLIRRQQLKISRVHVEVLLPHHDEILVVVYRRLPLPSPHSPAFRLTVLLTDRRYPFLLVGEQRRYKSKVSFLRAEQSTLTLLSIRRAAAFTIIIPFVSLLELKLRDIKLLPDFT